VDLGCPRAADTVGYLEQTAFGRIWCESAASDPLGRVRRLYELAYRCEAKAQLLNYLDDLASPPP